MRVRETAWRMMLPSLAVLMCSAALAHAQTEVTFSGVVRDVTTSRPLIGASVSLSTVTGPKSARTDETGRFTIPRVVQGIHTLSVRNLGYEPASRSITISDNEPVNLTLRRLATLDTVRIRAAPQAIYGTVATIYDEKPVPEATVQILGVSNGQVTTDSGGHFFYAVKSPGTYLVRAKAPGRGTQTVSLVLEENQGIEVSLLIDTVPAFGANELEQAYADMRERFLRRRNASLVLTRAQFFSRGDGDFTTALTLALGHKSLRLGSDACVFIDGKPRVGYWPRTSDTLDIEMIEVYSPTAEPSGTLSSLWGNNRQCGNTGMARANSAPGALLPHDKERASDIVKWIVIWLRH